VQLRHNHFANRVRCWAEYGHPSPEYVGGRVAFHFAIAATRRIHFGNFSSLGNRASASPCRPHSSDVHFNNSDRPEPGATVEDVSLDPINLLATPAVIVVLKVGLSPLRVLNAIPGFGWR
jgi:hypothetical protein